MTISLPPDPSSIRLAREFVAGHLQGCPDDTGQSAVLLTSELATNAILHADSAFVLSVDRGSTSVRIGVADHGDGRPVMRNPEPHEDSGRGLLLLDRISTAWGVEPSADGGKQVWFDLMC